jgi:hypothetical protein
MSEAAGQPHMRFRRSIILMFPRLDNKSLSAGGWLMYSPSGHHECRRTHAWDGLRPWGDAAWVLVGRCARAESCISCELGGWLMKGWLLSRVPARTHSWDGLRTWGDAAWVLSGRCARFEGCISCKPEYASAASGLARSVPFGYHECQPSLGTAAVMCVQLGSARDAAR